MEPSKIRRIRYRLWSAPGSPRNLDRALLLLGTFKQVGWFESMHLGRPVDRCRDPLPWYTYPAIYWLETVLKGNERVFEYGSGNSTLWFAQRVKSVAAIEHDEAWAKRLRPFVPDNVALRHVPSGASDVSMERSDPYVSAITHEQQEPYDIIVVDGKARNACCHTAVSYLRPGGMLILDNSDRKEYEPANRFLLSRRFARIDFIGPVPGNVGWSSTSVYSQDLIGWTNVQELPTKQTKTIGDFDGYRSVSCPHNT